MRVIDLQTRLQETGRYHGRLDDDYGPLTGVAVLRAMTDGPDTRLSSADLAASASRLGLQPAHISAVTQVEASGAGFENGRPVILFEPHRFSRSTKGKFDKAAPDVSYKTWDKTKYPRGQDARYDQLIKAVGLDVDAGFMSASYGRWQILGENFNVCGYPSAFDFAAAQAFDEPTQLKAFEAFITAKGLIKKLKAKDFEGFALGYNGTAAAANDYGPRLRRAFINAGGK